jgi:hypothetical protein
MNKKVFLLLLAIPILSCDSDSQELSFSEELIGAWTLTNYYSDSFFEGEEYGRIEKMVPEETDYGIEFADNPKKIILSGFLRYSFEEYEIVDGKKVTTYQATNFMDSEDGEGYHTGEWKIMDGTLICSDVSPQEGIAYSTISAIELSGGTLKLTLDNSQFGPHQSGETIIEYRKN